MPEHSETIVTATMNGSIAEFTRLDSGVNGLLTVAAYAARHRLQNATWTVTTTTQQGIKEVWRVQVTKDATP